MITDTSCDCNVGAQPRSLSCLRADLGHGLLARNGNLRQRSSSIEELLEHPVLGVQMTSEGIDRRCLDLMFDTASAQHRFAEAEYRERLAGSFTP